MNTRQYDIERHLVRWPTTDGKYPNLGVNCPAGAAFSIGVSHSVNALKLRGWFLMSDTEFHNLLRGKPR